MSMTTPRRQKLPTSRIRLDVVKTYIPCAWCGTEPRGLRVTLGGDPGTRGATEFEACASCLSDCNPSRPVGDRRCYCRACKSDLRGPYALRRGSKDLPKVDFCEPCAAKVIALAKDPQVRSYAVEYLDWEGEPPCVA